MSLTKTEDLKYQLQTLTTYTPEDLDYPNFEVSYETTEGEEGFLTVCCINLATRTLSYIEELEAKLADKTKG